MNARNAFLALLISSSWAASVPHVGVKVMADMHHSQPLLCRSLTFGKICLVSETSVVDSCVHIPMSGCTMIGAPLLVAGPEDVS